MALGCSHDRAGWRRAGLADRRDGALVGVDGRSRAAVVKLVVTLAAVKDPTAPVVSDTKGRPKPDPELRDAELVPLKEQVDTFIAREVTPYWDDAWVEDAKTKIGYEIPFGRHFYSFPAPRPVSEIGHDLRGVERRIADLIGEVTR